MHHDIKTIIITA